MDLAFLQGQAPLDGPERKPENQPVLIVLTDGLPNRVPFGPGSPYPGSQRQEDSVLQAVDQVKVKGSNVFTIGLGKPRDLLPWPDDRCGQRALDVFLCSAPGGSLDHLCPNRAYLR